MISVQMTSHAEFGEWRDAARKLIQNNINPSDVNWSAKSGSASLFKFSERRVADLPEGQSEIKTSAEFVGIAKRVICHSDPERFARLYRILHRLQADKTLIHNTVDPDIIWMTTCDKAVRRDRHKMHAFVRFRKVGIGRYHREQYAAWFEPSHYITELSTPFFMRRFPNMDWVIVTPHCTATWDGQDLKFSQGGKKSDVPPDDAVEDQWKTYFNSIFNPARLKVGAMMSEMPKKYWKNMPEAVDIPEMIAKARSREMAMRQHGVTQPNTLAATLSAQKKKASIRPAEITMLSHAKREIQSCQRCELYCHASQAVFGEGPDNARLMIIGEQPGDQEDIAGRPFVGPAGQLLNSALEEVGIDRNEAYVTNAVKHFKFKLRGKRRIHQRPTAREIDHCRWWLETERKLVKPDIILALGSSAARAVIGKTVKISDMRGRPHKLTDSTLAYISVHPSYLLRISNPEIFAPERNAFISDLSAVQNAVSANQ